MFLVFLKNIGPKEHRIPGPDYLGFYEPIAESISQGRGIPVKEVITEESAKKISQGKEIPIDEYLSFRYPIGYPLILSVLFDISNLFDIEKLRLIMIFNVFITALATCFLFLFVKSILSKRIALISAFLWASYPLNLWFIKNPNTEVPFIMIFYFALWVYILGVKKRSIGLFLVTGALIGFMSLIRPTAVFLFVPFTFLIFFLVKKSSFRQKILFSLILITAYIIVISPWIIYIYLNIGRIVPLSTNGSPSIAAGLTMIVDKIKEDTLIILPDDVVDLINQFRVTKIDSFMDISTFFFKKLVTQPITFLKLVIIKMVRSWYGISEMWWEREILAVQFLYLIPGIVGIGLWFRKIKEKFPYLLLLLAIIFYFWLATIVALSILRYMIPVMGIFMVFVAITINTIINNLVKSWKNGTQRNRSRIPF